MEQRQQRPQQQVNQVAIRPKPGPIPSRSGLQRSIQIAVPRRRKQWAPKSRGGCITCRRRKVRCDEVKPACRRCTAIKLPCEGYTALGSSSSASATHPYTAPASCWTWQQQRHQLHRQPAAKLAPVGLDPNCNELRMFALFRAETVRMVSGPFDQHFWRSDMLRAAQTYPAIWHAALALAAVHQRMEMLSRDAINSRIAHEYHVFALQHANRSIEHVTALTRQTHLSYSDQEVLLITNLLYVCVLRIGGNVAQAGPQWVKGLELYYNLRFWEQSDVTDGSSRGVLSFQTLNALIFYLEGAYSHLSVPRSTRPRRLILPTVLKFHSVSEAFLHFIPVCFMELLENSPERSNASSAPEAVFSRHKKTLGRYRASLDASTEFRAQHPREVSVIEVYLTHKEAALGCAASKTREEWIKHETKMETVFQLASQMALLQGESENAKHKSPIFSMSPHLGELLARLAFNCRIGSVRRKAIAFIKQHPFIMTLTESSSEMQLAEIKMRFEEQGRFRPNSTGPRGCECLDGVYVCRDHRASGHEMVQIDGEVYMRISSFYDRDQGLPGHLYKLENPSEDHKQNLTW